VNLVALNPEEEREARLKAKKNLLWIALVSIIMMFAGLTSAYIVRMAEGNWEHIELPQLFYFSTAVIIISSITINQAWKAAKNNNNQQLLNFIIITFILGLTFGVLQYLAWGKLVEQGYYFAGGTGGGASASYLYVLSGLHLLHVFGGLIALIVVFFRASKGIYKSGNLLGLQMCTIYWHFLDFLWIYLFLFLLFIR
jgi:cytochrome c oxidase subunit III